MIRSHRVPFLAAIALMLSLVGLSACNTMEGFGRDVEATGEEVQEQAQ